MQEEEKNPYHFVEMVLVKNKWPQQIVIFRAYKSLILGFGVMEAIFQLSKELCLSSPLLQIFCYILVLLNFKLRPWCDTVWTLN